MEFLNDFILHVSDCRGQLLPGTICRLTRASLKKVSFTKKVDIIIVYSLDTKYSFEMNLGISQIVAGSSCPRQSDT